MNKYLLFTLLLLPVCLFSATENYFPIKLGNLGFSNSFRDTSDTNNDDAIFQVVENMPRFPGCEDIADKNERNNCANEKMLEYIYSHIKYPAAFQAEQIEGTVVARFVVEKDGSLSSICILRTIGIEASEEVTRMLQLMQEEMEWIPGNQRNIPVRVYFNLPVKFEFDPNNIRTERDPNIVVPTCGQGQTDQPKITSFNAFPNPTAGALTIDFDSENGLCGRYAIVGVEGRINWEGDLGIKAGNNRIELPIEDLHKGFHVLLLQNTKGDILKTHKFIKL